MVMMSGDETSCLDSSILFLVYLSGTGMLAFARRLLDYLSLSLRVQVESAVLCWT